MENKNVVILFSGGLDSTCLVLYYLSNGYNVHAYGFDYGQRQINELHLAQENVTYLQSLGLPITYQVINVQDIFSDSTACLVTHEDCPDGTFGEDTVKAIDVENRNVIFSSIVYGKALSLAKRINQNVIISIGIHKSHHCVCLDATEESYKAAQHLFKISNWDSDKVSYEAPFVHITKPGVLRAGLQAISKLNITDTDRDMILRNTVSCFNTNDKGDSCGKCGTCTERLEAFKVNNIKDPIPYITDEKIR